VFEKQDQVVKQKPSFIERALTYAQDAARLQFLERLFPEYHLLRLTEKHIYYHGLIEACETRGIKLSGQRKLSENVMKYSPSFNGLGRGELKDMFKQAPVYGIVGSPFEEKGGIVEWLKNKFGGGDKRE